MVLEVRDFQYALKQERKWRHFDLRFFKDNEPKSMDLLLFPLLHLKLLLFLLIFVNFNFLVFFGVDLIGIFDRLLFYLVNIENILE